MPDHESNESSQQQSARLEMPHSPSTRRDECSNAPNDNDAVLKLSSSPSPAPRSANNATHALSLQMKPTPGDEQLKVENGKERAYEDPAGDEAPQNESIEEEPIGQYSNEARVYHARYAELSDQHDKGNFSQCREGCLDLLTESRLPRYTRIQTLQMLSTILAPEQAKSCLLDASAILSKMDTSKIQVQLLLKDNEAMLADLQA